MNEVEQQAMQIWLGNLLRLLREKNYLLVESELAQALGIIEEDHQGADPRPPAI